MSKEIVIALIGLGGPIVGAIALVVVEVLKIREARRLQNASSDQDQTHAGQGKNRRTGRNLKRRRVIISIWILSTLASLIYLIWLPGSGNRWFVTIHAISIAVATLSGVGMLILTSPRLDEKRSGNVGETWRLSITIFIFLVFLVAAGYVGLQFRDWEKLWPSTKLMTVGWDLYNREDFKGAISVTDQCGDDFHVAAKNVEDTLVGKQVPVGKVTAEEMNAVFANGVLNDVAACYWIKGRSAQKLHRTDEARVAFNQVLHYPHGRVYDERGHFFWSPAEDAEDRLKDLQ